MRRQLAFKLLASLASAAPLLLAAPARAGTGPWSSAGTFTTGRQNHGMLALGGAVYVAGGDNGSSPFADVQVAQLFSGLGTFSTTTALPAARRGIAMAGSGQHLYVVFGGTDTSVYYATQQSGGSIASWGTSAGYTGLRSQGGALAINGRLYVVGGQTDSGSPTYYADVQSAPINSDGSLGAWRTEPATLPAARSQFGYAYDPTNAVVYVVGGSDGQPRNQIYSAFVSVSGGGVSSFVTNTPLPAPLQGLSTFVSGGYLYAVGGLQTSPINQVWAARIQAEGTLGSWSPQPAFNGAREYHQTAVSGSTALLSGGTGGSSPYNDVQIATISNPGAPSKLGFATASYTATASQCSGPVTIGLQDTGGLATWADTTTLINVSSTANAVLHGVAGCGDTSFTQIVLPDGRTSGNVWFVASGAAPVTGTVKVTITASSSGLTGASQDETISVGGDGGTDGGTDAGTHDGGTDAGNQDGGQDAGQGNDAGSTDDPRTVNGFGCSAAPLGPLAGLLAFAALLRRRRQE